MEKLKVYLDTSVISHLMQEDVPEKMADTLKLWKKFQIVQNLREARCMITWNR